MLRVDESEPATPGLVMKCSIDEAIMTYSPVNLGLDPKQIATESFSFAFITLKAKE